MLNGWQICIKEGIFNVPFRRVTSRQLYCSGSVGIDRILKGYTIKLEIDYYWYYVKCMRSFLSLMSMSNSDPFQDNNNDLAIQEVKPKLKKPPLYKVILLNDDFTPMDFVIEILMVFFAMPQEKATQIMLQIHMQGVGVCGTFSKDVAETKVYLVNQYSREHQHPLLCTMEEA